MKQREFFNVIINGTGSVTVKAEDGKKITKEVSVSSPEIVEFAKGRIKHLDDVNSARQSKLSPKQRENEEIIQTMLDTLEKGVTYTAADISKTTGVSSPIISALCQKLVDRNLATKSKVKIKGKSPVNGYTLI